MTRRILILDAHPGTGRFSTALAARYAQGVRAAGGELREIALRDLAFDPILHEGYAVVQPLEPDLERAFDELLRADHVAFFYPTWWGGHPALLQGFFERVFLPGKAFRYHEKDPFWDKLLKGRSAEIVTTMDTPGFYYRLVYRNSGLTRIRKTILEFTGMRTRVHAIGNLRGKSAAQRERLLARAEALGRRAAA
ncbi:NAD(P)H-dependent oxidoreductase [Celeribacter indicus]|uniref:NAD(P)H dehydrogenase (Quinone) n=1 Tax=Celeribacter indicus TaxID=1208324 RepID=A0A0B5E0X0_9RHOB|nr:NAD(P)H-dependent oxidoreductase [Celeribacter indicus]AJE47060.1 NAD(P)H dehydrogenase (quinone) [Celeribacter indicus]SDW91908.1 Putative NADPH-quinone reductase (modulator of drug activity B) [Celeribacter indicus]